MNAINDITACANREQDENLRTPRAHERAQAPMQSRPKRRGYCAYQHEDGKVIPSVKLYVMECAGYLKVGLAANAQKRLAGIQAHCPLPVRLVSGRSVRLDMAGEAEHRAHSTLWAHHHHGEWFQCEEGVALKAISSAASWANGRPFIWNGRGARPEIYALIGDTKFLTRVRVKTVEQAPPTEKEIEEHRLGMLRSYRSLASYATSQAADYQKMAAEFEAPSEF